MMADLMNEHMRDKMTETFLALGPVVQDGTPVQEHHIRFNGLRKNAFLVETDAPVEAHEIEWAFDLQLVQHLVGREILDPDHNVPAQLPKLCR